MQVVFLLCLSIFLVEQRTYAGKSVESRIASTSSSKKRKRTRLCTKCRSNFLENASKECYEGSSSDSKFVFVPEKNSNENSCFSPVSNSCPLGFCPVESQGLALENQSTVSDRALVVTSDRALDRMISERHEEIENCKLRLADSASKKDPIVVDAAHQLALDLTIKTLEETSSSECRLDAIAKINQFFPEVYFKLFGESPTEFNYSVRSVSEIENGVVAVEVISKKSANFQATSSSFVYYTTH